MSHNLTVTPRLCHITLQLHQDSVFRIKDSQGREERDCGQGTNNSLNLRPPFISVLFKLFKWVNSYIEFSISCVDLLAAKQRWPLHRGYWNISVTCCWIILTIVKICFTGGGPKVRVVLLYIQQVLFQHKMTKPLCIHIFIHRLKQWLYGVVRCCLHKKWQKLKLNNLTFLFCTQ